VIKHLEPLRQVTRPQDAATDWRVVSPDHWVVIISHVRLQHSKPPLSLTTPDILALWLQYYAVVLAAIHICFIRASN